MIGRLSGMKVINVGIYIYKNAEVLDFSGPCEVFSTASRVCEDVSPFNVFLISEAGGMVSARGNYNVIPNFSFDDHPPIDLLIVVGGKHDDEMNKPQVINWISMQAKNTVLNTSICTGAFLLAQAKVIQRQKVTTHWEDVRKLQDMFPLLSVEKNVRWVEDGAVITSAGISAGIDMSLYCVSKMYNKDLAIKTAKQMEYVW
jgi:transcriptional regulator GlxA family with amidase domain